LKNLLWYIAIIIFFGFFAFLLLIPSFTSDFVHESKRQAPSTSGTLSYTDSSKTYSADFKRLIGRWSICTVIDNGSLISFNTCPKVKFNSNGTFYIGDPTFNLVSGEWELNGEKLKLNTIAKENLLPTGEYEIHYTSENDSSELRLTPKGTDSAYILGKISDP
jgi:hypothetical protein